MFPVIGHPDVNIKFNKRMKENCSECILLSQSDAACSLISLSVTVDKKLMAQTLNFGLMVWGL